MGGAEGEQGLALEGLFTPVEKQPCGGAVIAPPHPLYGGSMDVPVVTEIAHACAQAELTSLRFNWRGAGGSAGELSGEPAHADEDYLASLRFLEQSVDRGVIACGYSFGAAAASRVGPGRPRVRGLLLVAPPLAALDPASLVDLDVELLVAVGADDRIAPAKELEKIVERAKAATFVTIPHADHFFQRGLAELCAAASEWLSGRDLRP